MRLSIDVTLNYAIDGAADVLLLIEAAKGPDQRLLTQDFTVWSNTPLRAVPGEEGIGQRCWLHAEGSFHAEYRATVEILRQPRDFAELGDTPIRLMPPETIPYLLPSRYCESDRLEGFVEQEFGGLSAGPLASALVDWVAGHLTYASGTSSGTTTALMTFAERRGVCRDYAHLLVALARAGGIPARCVSAYAPGVDPPDFHAVAELWIDGDWHLVDATRMASSAELARVAVGRDATDIAFMTVFGRATMNQQRVTVTRLP
ncbi:transglutaminase-like putative cysteine protease [Sphingomonas sp. BE270]|jgi:transglutaminase-like putative cysteine protease|uniref:transglutaminase-like domain-containing protein n=1 Tax=unclassified Sphingomonas TaxID=196159 RepID=UPI001485008D|nr:MULTISPECIES: transglutaminase family protein [unclassified Sphingomonas]MDR6847615.1 transglutaminase-like putative cysteine protease [Sphingomonas sp. BE137]MDR7257647.1 transglutaminase-like putative cysteine protease [Sphingomonas sp. BE270]